MINICKNTMKFDIDLTTANDCEFVLDVLKSTDAYGELYAINYDGNDHLTCAIYIDVENFDELLKMFPVFENITCDECEFDETDELDIINIKKTVIDDIHEIKTAYAELEKLIERYSIE